MSDQDRTGARVVRAQISEQPLDLAAHLADVADPTAGAVVAFAGQVRDHDPEAPGAVVGLDYSAHPDAQAMLQSAVERAIAATAAPGERVLVSVAHRIGHLAVGDLAVVVTTATAHRGLAYAVNRAVIEAVKHEVPIWKQQFTADGASGWVGL